MAKDTSPYWPVTPITFTGSFEIDFCRIWSARHGAAGVSRQLRWCSALALVYCQPAAKRIKKLISRKRLVPVPYWWHRKFQVCGKIGGM